MNCRSLVRKIRNILRSNEGASLVLVAVLAIVVLTAVVMLRVSTSTLIASANKQLNQDQAYELAASMGESVDDLIYSGKLDINAIQITSPDGVMIAEETDFANMPDSSVIAVIKKNDNGNKVLIVTAHVAEASYVYTREYR